MNDLASGFLTSHFIYSLILTIPASLLLLARYRRELLRGMLAAAAGHETATASGAAQNSEHTGSPPTGGPPRGPIVRTMPVMAS